VSAANLKRRNALLLTPKRTSRATLRSATIALILVAAIAERVTAQAQEAGSTYWGADNCFYQQATNPVMPEGQPGSHQAQLLGCRRVVGNRVVYVDYGRQAFREEQSGLWLKPDTSAGFLLWTTHGWQPALDHPASQTLLAEMLEAHQPQNAPLPARHPFIKPGEPLMAHNVRVNIPMNDAYQTPEEKIWLRQSIDEMITQMIVSTERRNCEQNRAGAPKDVNGNVNEGWYEDMTGVHQKAC
jgi:hypothetical protein